MGSLLALISFAALCLTTFVAGQGGGFQYVTPSQDYQKSGTCPHVRNTPCSSVAVKCSSDSTCLGRQKCCSTGCGYACVSPASENPWDATTRSSLGGGSWDRQTTRSSLGGGSWDRHTTRSSLGGAWWDRDTTRASLGGSSWDRYTTRSSLGGSSWDRATTRSSLGGSWGNSNVEKAGRCGPQIGYRGGCTNMCTRDFDCAGSSKCCRNACASVCIDPREAW